VVAAGRKHNDCGGDIMGPKVEPKLTPFTNLTLKAKDNLSKFEFNPGKLPNSELKQLWKVAARKDLEELCEEIEKELMKRGNETKI
jgi:hypothetical protein